MPNIDEFYDNQDRLSQLSEEDTVFVSPQLMRQEPDVVQQVLDEQAKEDKYAQEMSEVELRLEEANWYRALLSNSLFNNSGPIADKVEAEVRDFVRSRLRVLLGIDPEKKAVNEVFSQPEIVALKGLAARITGQRGPAQPSAPQKAEMRPVPQVNQAQAPVSTPVLNQPVKPVKSQPAPVKPKVEPKKASKKIKKTISLPDGSVKEVEIEPFTAQVGQKPRTIEQIQEIANMAAAKAVMDTDSYQVGGVLGELIKVGTK
jgi:hypothetical protein